MTLDKLKQLVEVCAHRITTIWPCNDAVCALQAMLQLPKFVHQTGHLVLPAGGAAARAELGLTDNYYDTSAGQRERMLKTTEKLDKTTDRIQQGRAQLAETEVMPLVVRKAVNTLHFCVCLKSHFITCILACQHAMYITR